MDEDASVAWSDDDSVKESEHRALSETGDALSQPTAITLSQVEGPAEEEDVLSVAWSDGDSIDESERSDASERTEPPPPPPPPLVAPETTLPSETVMQGEPVPLPESKPPAKRALVATDEETRVPGARDEESVSWSDDSGRSETPPLLPATMPATQPEEAIIIQSPVQGALHSELSVAETVASAAIPDQPALVTAEDTIAPAADGSTSLPTLMQEQLTPQQDSESSERREPTKHSKPPRSKADSEPPLPRASAAPTNNTDYPNVFCGPVEGRLEVADERIQFIPSVPDKLPSYNPIPYDIAWKDTTYLEFYKENVKAGYQSYQTVMTSYNLKIGVVPSKEAIFSVRSAEVWDRMKCDLDARGIGVPPPPQKDKEALDPGLLPLTASWMNGDEYDHSEAVYDDSEEQVHWNDEEEHDEEAPKQQDCKAAEEEGIRWSDEEDENVDAAEVLQPQSTTRQMGMECTDEFENVGDGWAAQDAANTTTSSYYPVTCKGEVGNLVLTGCVLQFIPDKYSAAVKSIPFAAFAGRPFFAPSSHPIAQMAVHYRATQGPNKKVGFELDNHDELLRLEDDIKDRIGPYKHTTKEKVYVLPNATDSLSSFSHLDGGGGLVSKLDVYKSNDASITEETMSFGGEGPITAASRPLIANTARRVPYHKDGPSRRLILLFMSYCCIATLAGLTFSVLFGYFFGPRRPKEQYIRTQSPYQIGEEYTRTRPPTTRAPSVAPTLKDFQWNSDAVTMIRTTTEPPGGTSDLLGEKKASPETNAPQDGLFGDGTMGSGIGRPAPGSYVNSPGSGMGSSEAMRGADFELSTDAPREMLTPTWAPTGMIVTRTTSEPPATTLISGEQSPVPTSGKPTIVPTSEEPTRAPSTATPTVLVTRSNKSIVALLMEKSPDKGAKLRTPGTPQQAAYLLMKVSGLLEDAPSDDMILQKYAMSTLYYASGGNDWAAGSNSWKELAGSDCSKPHIICDGVTGETLGIKMNHNNMVGSLPPEIGLLDKLTSISFEDNSLEGMIPTEIGLLKNLQTLDLAGNPKLGALPDEVSSLPRLVTVKVDSP